MPEPWQQAGFGLYLHWPFCQAKCPYCDFNSHVVGHIDQERWQRAYLSEIDRLGSETPDRVLRSVFFGGGTPSMMDPSLVQAILDRVRQTWRLANDCEITLEANPTSVEADRFAGYSAAGVNRVSLGVQALNNPDLKRLGRLHTAAEARAAIDTAMSTFDRVSFDLIYARQDQTLADWREELQAAIEIGVAHLSLYQLTIEDGTAFGDRFAAGRLRGLPDEDRAADMFEATQEICRAAGLHAYEISNHARPGQLSRHNLIYWQSGDWAGIGPGAHGRLTLDGVRLATSTPLGPVAWLRAVEEAGCGEEPREQLSPADQAAEYLMMGLRLNEGISTERLQRLVGDKYLKNIYKLEADGVILAANGHITLAPGYRPLLNAVLRDLLVD